MLPRITSNSRTPSDPPASVFQLWVLQVCTMGLAPITCFIQDFLVVLRLWLLVTFKLFRFFKIVLSIFFFAVLYFYRHHAVFSPQAPSDLFYWWLLDSCLTYLTSQGVKVYTLVFLAELWKAEVPGDEQQLPDTQIQ